MGLRLGFMLLSLYLGSGCASTASALKHAVRVADELTSLPGRARLGLADPVNGAVATWELPLAAPPAPLAEWPTFAWTDSPSMPFATHAPLPLVEEFALGFQAKRALMPIASDLLPSTQFALSSQLYIELCTASELQETDTAGYWDEFHLGRSQDHRLDLAWRWRQSPGLFWIGNVGATRLLDRTAPEAIDGPDLTFVALGACLRF